MSRIYLLFFISALVLSSCNTATLELKNVNLNTFKTDRGACKSVRTGQIESLKKDAGKVLGISENDVLANFGRYDIQLLDERNTKLFIYYLETGVQCQDPRMPSQVTTMAIWFNATKMVREVTFQVGFP